MGWLTQRIFAMSSIIVTDAFLQKYDSIGKVKPDAVSVEFEDMPQRFSVYLRSVTRRLLCRFRYNFEQLLHKELNLGQFRCFAVVGPYDIVNALGFFKHRNAGNSRSVLAAFIVANLSKPVDKTLKSLFRAVDVISHGIWLVLRGGEALLRSDLLQSYLEEDRLVEAPGELCAQWDGLRHIGAGTFMAEIVSIGNILCWVDMLNTSS